jgi:uncharacterized protein YndB with AHSA1/START domain
VAVQASREIVIDAPPEVILEALADVGSVPSWSPVHKRAEVIDSYPDGRPHHVKVTIRIVGIVDTEVLEYHWGPDWLVWDADKTLQQHAQHVEYTLQRQADDKTRVRFDITLEPSAPIPEFLINRARKRSSTPPPRGCDGGSWVAFVQTGRHSRSVAQSREPADRFVECVVALAEGEPHQVIPLNPVLVSGITERRHRDRGHPDLFG